MKKIILDQYKHSLFNLSLFKDEDKIGRLTIYPYKKTIGWLDFYIKEKWRCKWLSKSFAKFMYQTLMVVAKEHCLKYIFTELKNPKSLRLLDFFNFSKYNEKYYYLLIC